mmetsp:Transcript_106876/g.312440  ORF Transcript_106876/g.312440 Transcript_106876/m.312440 type:complete len:272 (-) Transcript_106876:95-910(-)
MDVVGKTLAGETVTIKVDPTTTVLQAKRFFASSLAIDTTQQTLKLIYGTEVLNNSSVLAACGIEEGSSLTIVTSKSRWQADLRPEQLQVTDATHGTFSSDEPREPGGFPTLKLDMNWASGHSWTETRLDVPEEVGWNADCVSAHMKMRHLAPNAAYCNVMLATDGADPQEGLLEVKFDHNALRGYGPAVTQEDFGIPVPSVQGRTWLHLAVVLDRGAQGVNFFVDGTLIKHIALHNGSWQRIAAVVLKGYAKDTLQWWAGVMVCLHSELEG